MGNSFIKNFAICIGINGKWVFAAAALLMSIRDNLTEIDTDIIIIHDSVSQEEQRQLNQILPCRFIQFKHPVPNSIRNSRGTHMKFSRLLCFDLLEEYKKVIWLDTDMLILKPIDDLFSYGETGLAMMPHRHTLRQIYKKICSTWSSDSKFDKYNFNVPVNNTGLMIFSNKLKNPQNLKDWCFEKMEAWSDINTSIQPVITLMLQEFNIEIEEIPRMFNCPLNEHTRKTIILHAWGDIKFWDNLDFPKWNSYYQKWLDIGGRGPLSQDDLNHAKKHLISKFIKKSKIYKICKRIIYLIQKKLGI